MNGARLVWLLLAALLSASVWRWWRVARRLARGEPMLSLEPRATEVVAVHATLLAIVMALLVPSLFALGWLHYRGVTPEEYSRQASALSKASSGAKSGDALNSAAVAEPALFDELRLIDALARLLTVIAVGIMLNRWFGPSDFLPILRRTWSADLWLGLAGFVLIVPPVLLVKVGISKLIDASPMDESHPLIQRIRAEPGQWAVFAVVGLSAVVAAPLYEELLFRQLIQGFLQRLDAWRVRHNARRSHRSSSTPSANQQLHVPHEATEALPTGYWPMLVSAALFAAVHLGHGVDPLPLFLLGTGLGYLYRQTNRLLPCVVVHALLNGLTLLQLAAEAADRGTSPIP